MTNGYAGYDCFPFSGRGNPQYGVIHSQKMQFVGHKDCSHDDFLQGLKYAVATSNLFFRTLRACGIFIMDPMKSILYHAGQEMYVSWIIFSFVWGICQKKATHFIMWDVAFGGLELMSVFAVLHPYSGSLWAHGCQVFRWGAKAIQTAAQDSFPTAFDIADGGWVISSGFFSSEWLGWTP